MIKGHGDDLYLYDDIRVNFSSNIFSHADLSGLKRHLASRLDVIASYPEPEPYSLERMLADQLHIDDRCIMVTNGATEAIYLIAQAFNHCHPVVHEPTFAEYASACSHIQGTTELHFICNPNNPTGKACQLSFCNDAIYVVDQAYENYTLQPMLNDADTVQTHNVILLHSMTKRFCIPGLRLGYVTAHPDIIGRLRQHRQPWSVNALAIEAGKYLLTHGIPNFPDIHQYLAETQRLWKRLNAIDGIEMLPTDTTFMLGTVSRMTASQLKELLAYRYHILIRDASNFNGLSPHHFRVATQTPEENDMLVDAIHNILKTS